MSFVFMLRRVETWKHKIYTVGATSFVENPRRSSSPPQTWNIHVLLCQPLKCDSLRGRRTTTRVRLSQFSAACDLGWQVGGMVEKMSRIAVFRGTPTSQILFCRGSLSDSLFPFPFCLGTFFINRSKGEEFTIAK